MHIATLQPTKFRCHRRHSIKDGFAERRRSPCGAAGARCNPCCRPSAGGEPSRVAPAGPTSPAADPAKRAASERPAGPCAGSLRCGCGQGGERCTPVPCTPAAALASARAVPGLGRVRRCRRPPVGCCNLSLICLLLEDTGVHPLDSVYQSGGEGNAAAGTCASRNVNVPAAARATDGLTCGRIMRERNSLLRCASVRSTVAERRDMFDLFNIQMVPLTSH
jgi:hypothetical protein